MLAGRLHVLQSALAGLAAGAPTEVFVDVSVSAGAAGQGAASFAAEIARMYERWGARRGMRVDRLAASPGCTSSPSPGSAAAYLLAPEAGLHVLEQAEEGDDGTLVDREHVRVVVAGREPGSHSDAEARLDDAREALARVEPTTVVVRRYRPGRSPLVRDTVRGYRTGRIDRVLAGDFDLY